MRQRKCERAASRAGDVSMLICRFCTADSTATTVAANDCLVALNLGSRMSGMSGGFNRSTQQSG